MNLRRFFRIAMIVRIERRITNKAAKSSIRIWVTFIRRFVKEHRHCIIGRTTVIRDTGVASDWLVHTTESNYDVHRDNDCSIPRLPHPNSWRMMAPGIVAFRIVVKNGPICVMKLIDHPVNRFIECLAFSCFYLIGHTCILQYSTVY